MIRGHGIIDRVEQLEMLRFGRGFSRVGIVESSANDERTENRTRMKQRMKCALGVFLFGQKIVIRESSAWKKKTVLSLGITWKHTPN